MPSGDTSSSGDTANEDKVYLCKYKVKTFVISMEDEKIELDHSNILAIEYLNDYERNIMALLKVSIRVDIRRRLWIIKNKMKIKVKFELVKLGYDIEEEKEIISEEEVWNEEFTPYFSDEDDYSDIESLEKRLETSDQETSLDDIEGENYYETQNQFDLYLFQCNLLKASRFSFNKIFTEDTLQNMVAEMLTESKHERVLMSKFDNEETYKEMLVPALPLFKGLIYLDQYFGFYEKGALIYYDANTAYIIKTDGKVSAKREDEWSETNFIVNPITSSQPGHGMIRKGDEKVFYLSISENEVNVQKMTDAQNIELGNDVTVVQTDDIEIQKTEGTLNPENTNKNEIIALVKKGTKYTSTMLQARIDENECVLFINGENFDLNAFTPNKTYKITFKETTKQERFGKNTYRLAYAYSMLRIASMELMESTHKIVLKKTDGPSQGDD